MIPSPQSLGKLVSIFLFSSSSCDPVSNSYYYSELNYRLSSNSGLPDFGETRKDIFGDSCKIFGRTDLYLKRGATKPSREFIRYHHLVKLKQFTEGRISIQALTGVDNWPTINVNRYTFCLETEEQVPSWVSIGGSGLGYGLSSSSFSSCSDF
jgi:hypothetical protein